MVKEEFVINQELLIWCAVVVIELFVLTWLVQSGFVLLLALILIAPVKAALNWPMNTKKAIEEQAEQSENNTEETAEAE